MNPPAPRRNSTPSAGEPAAVAEVEQAIALFMRHVNRPGLWRRLASSSGIRLDRPQYVTLTRIEETPSSDGVRLTELAEAVGLDISTLSRQVRSLELEGLVERKADPCDHRAQRIALTAAGRLALNRARQVRQEITARLLEEWTPEERALFADMLQRLVRDMAAVAAETAGATDWGRRPSDLQTTTAARGRRP